MLSVAIFYFYAECQYAECRDLFIVMLNIIMLSVFAPEKSAIAGLL